MRKLVLFAILSIIPLLLSSDYIIPTDDPVYSFLETTQNLHDTEKLHSVYPLYYDDILSELQHIISSDIPKSYKKIAEYHVDRLRIDSEKGFHSALYPIKKLPHTFVSIFKNRSNDKLFTIKKENMDIVFSGILGVNYDVKQTKQSHHNRLLKYYGLELKGNISHTIGIYSLFRKGHYTGKPYFTRKDSAQIISDNWENPEMIDIQTECFLTTKSFDASIGYGNFQIGNSITNSIILTKDISSIPYIKISKRFGDFSYVSLYSQLVPDSLGNEDEYSGKSYAMQMITYTTDKLSISIGENALYDDRNFDLSYSTPLIMYKLVDFANQSRDNVNAFVLINYNPFKGLLLYNNLFVDDVKLSRLTTEKYLSGFAEQFGISYSFNNIPFNLTFEGTAVGPRTYYHRRKLTYSHRDQLLGFQYGSNLLNLAFQIQYLLPGLECKILYENMQQGSISNDPFSEGQTNEKFLAGSISRTQSINASINFNITSHLNVHLQYVYENIDDREKNYLYSGIELKY